MRRLINIANDSTSTPLPGMRVLSLNKKSLPSSVKKKLAGQAERRHQCDVCGKVRARASLFVVILIFVKILQQLCSYLFFIVVDGHFDLVVPNCFLHSIKFDYIDE